MKRKLLLIGIIIVVIGGLCFASCHKEARSEEVWISEWIARIPALKQGVGYSISEGEFNYLSTVEVLKWKGVSLEAGYNAKDKLVGVLSYQIFKLKDFGIEVPILNLLECNVGLYAGWGRLDFSKEGNREFDWGPSITLISVRF